MPRHKIAAWKAPKQRQRHPIYCLQINIACRSLFPFQLPTTPLCLITSPSSCIYRGSRATFTIKSLMQFHTLQSLHIIFVYTSSIPGVELIDMLLPTASFLTEWYLTEPAAKISPWRLLPPLPIVAI